MGSKSSLSPQAERPDTASYAPSDWLLLGAVNDISTTSKHTWPGPGSCSLFTDSANSYQVDVKSTRTQTEEMAQRLRVLANFILRLWFPAPMGVTHNCL